MRPDEQVPVSTSSYVDSATLRSDASMIVRVLSSGFSVAPSTVTLDSSELPLSSDAFWCSTKPPFDASTDSSTVPFASPSSDSV